MALESRKRVNNARLRGLSKGCTYRFSPDVALELELYGLVQRYGTRKQIIERSLNEYFRQNPLPKKLRDAALLIVDEGAP